MEDEKKKKKYKKKKNKQQTKAAASAVDDTASSDTGGTCSVGTISGDQDNGSNIGVEDERASNANGSASVDIVKQHRLQEEARLRDMVKQLLYEKNSYIQRQAELEMKMKQLHSENDSWHQKEVGLEQRINQLLQENAALSFAEKKLLENIQCVEKEKLFLAEKENLSKETISTLNNEIARLKMQVLELEGAKTTLSQENMQVLDNLSTSQSRVQDLEKSLMTVVSPADVQNDVFEKENLNAEIEEAYALIGKLMTENAELVEKVNQLSIKLGQQAEVRNDTSVDILDNSYANPLYRFAEDMEDVSLATKSVELFGTGSKEDEQMVTDEMHSDYANVRHSSETTVSGEIVQIPLVENESHDVEAHAYVIAGDESVPLVDAPLIGAPFRLISFVTKYVSGADLVNKDSSNSLQ
ncbi:unnamed protein product [Amaranthus hypochondriacus]